MARSKWFAENPVLPKKIIFYIGKHDVYGPYLNAQAGRYLKDTVHHEFMLDEHGNYMKTKKE
jgi:hypothetical protein